MARSRAKRKSDAPKTKTKKRMKKRRSRAAARRVDKVTTARTSSRFFVSNPTDFSVLNDVAPAVAGYAGTRLLGRIAMVQIGKRWPQLGRWANVIGTSIGFGATWLLGNRINPIERWHQPITIGAAIAAVQTVVQTALPQVGWMVSDCDMSQYQAQQTPILTPAAPAAAPSATSDYEDDDEYGFEDEQASNAGGSDAAAPVTDDATDDQGTDEDFDTGIFSNDD